MTVKVVVSKSHQPCCHEMGTLGAETKDNKQQTDWWAVTSNDKVAARK